MKYWAPINSPGGIDGNDSYVNANPSIGVQGSIPSFQSFEQTLRGLQNLIIKSRMTPNPSIDDLQVAEAIRSQQLNWTQTFGGTANGLTAVLDPLPLSLALLVGVPIHGIAAYVNTGAATLQVSSLPQRPIVLPSGAQIPAGAIQTNAILVLMYDGTNFQVLSGLVEGGGVPVEGGYHVIKQPHFYGYVTLVAPTNVAFYPGSYSMAVSNLGDANFNTTNGVLTAGAKTKGTWLISAANVPIDTITNKCNITMYGPGAPWGIVASQTSDVNNAGGYSTHVHLTSQVLLGEGQSVSTAHEMLYANACYCTIAGIRIAGGPP